MQCIRLVTCKARSLLMSTEPFHLQTFEWLLHSGSCSSPCPPCPSPRPCPPRPQQGGRQADRLPHQPLDRLTHQPLLLAATLCCGAHSYPGTQVSRQWSFWHEQFCCRRSHQGHLNYCNRYMYVLTSCSLFWAIVWRLIISFKLLSGPFFGRDDFWQYC